MDRVRMMICFNGRWEDTREGGQKYVGFSSKGVLVPKNLTYEGLLMVLETKLEYDSSRYEMDIKGLYRANGNCFKHDINDNDDMEFVMCDDQNVPEICVSFKEISGNHGRLSSRNSTNRPLTAGRNVPDVGRTTSCNVLFQRTVLDNEDQVEGGNLPHTQFEPPVRETENLYEEIVQDEPYEGEGEEEGVCPGADGAENVPSMVAAEWVIPGSESYSFGETLSCLTSTPSTLVYKGQFFPCKKDLKRALGIYALRENFEWRVKRSNKSVFHAICKEENCTWKCRAVRRKDGAFFEVRGLINEHTCALEEVHRHHRQAGYAIIGEVIAPRLQHVDGRIMCAKDIIADMKEMFGIQIMYSKAHKALQYALNLTYGDAAKSYGLLPAYCYLLEHHNPGTMTRYEVDFLNKFKYFFMALGQSIRGFRECMRPVIAVDGTHLKGRFKGTMFVAAAKDGNEQIYPLAFGYGESENNASWEWFMTLLKAAVGDVEDLVIISDRHASIATAVEEVFPQAVHGLCAWHLGQNLKKTFHREDLKQIFNQAASAYNRFQFDHHMNELARMHRRCYEELMKVGPHKWSRVHCPRRRYEMMTTNIAESLNSCLRFARQLPVTTLAEFIRNMLQRWFFNRRQKAESTRSQLCNAAQEKIQKWVGESNSMTAHHVDWHVFMVKCRGDEWNVDLKDKTCSCGIFQALLLPCAHALAAIRERNLDFTGFCAEYYMKTTLIVAYSSPIFPVGPPGQWAVPEDVGDKVVLEPDVHPQTGRPKKSRIPSAGEHARRQKCTRCGSSGHNSRRCPNPHSRQNEGRGGSSSTRVQAGVRKKCSICHEVGHNRLTCLYAPQHLRGSSTDDERVEPDGEVDEVLS